MPHNFIQTIIDDAERRLGFRTRREMVEYLRPWFERAGLKPPDNSMITRYQNGERYPPGERIAVMLEAFNVDIAAALPDSQARKMKRARDALTAKGLVRGGINAAVAANGGAIPVVGSVNAGTGDVVMGGDSTGDETASLSDFANNAPSWHLGAGSPMAIRVHGESMEPDYPDGSLIVARSVGDADPIPNGRDCVFQIKRTGETTMKRLIRLAFGRMVGLPLNHAYQPFEWDVGEAAITHVVVGKVVGR